MLDRRLEILKKAATGAAFLVAAAASGALLVAKASPEPAAGRNVPTARLAAGKSFAPICNVNARADFRSYPAWVGESFAGDNCRAPRMPAALNGLTASREQVVAGMTAAKKYIALSEVFQRCVRDFVADRVAEAEKGKKPMDKALVIIENHRLVASQNNRKKAAGQIEIAINAFNEYGSECPDY